MTVLGRNSSHAHVRERCSPVSPVNCSAAHTALRDAHSCTSHPMDTHRLLRDVRPRLSRCRSLNIVLTFLGPHQRIGLAYRFGKPLA
jgi:hypothetical protein